MDQHSDGIAVEHLAHFILMANIAGYCGVTSFRIMCIGAVRIHGKDIMTARRKRRTYMAADEAQSSRHDDHGLSYPFSVGAPNIQGFWLERAGDFSLIGR
jgi:hypothetical protein